jgi:phage terminase large subunit GpA-like protein
MNSMTQPMTPLEIVLAAGREVLRVLKPPPTLTLIEWADTERRVSSKNSATPGRWKTSAQPCAFGPMAAVLAQDIPASGS